MRLFARRVLLATALCPLAAAPALAHPGHGADGGSNDAIHYATEPVHVAPVIAAVVAGAAVAGGAAVWMRRRS